jgi:SAM-dependent methyltransferase
VIFLARFVSRYTLVATHVASRACHYSSLGAAARRLMWPRGAIGQIQIRTKVRDREAALILNVLDPLLRQARQSGGNLRVLEIGSGSGDQTSRWLELGQLIATDIRLHQNLRLPRRGASFVLCDVQLLPFRSASFDVIVANHVLEHIADLKTGFAELRRVGSHRSLWAFALPTPTWLVLSLPTQYLWKLFNLLGRFRRLIRYVRRPTARHPAPGPHTPDDEPEFVQHGFLSKLTPFGHGAYPTFLGSLHAFRPSRWRAVFLDAGYEIVAEDRLLLYSTARWPIVPCCRWPTRLGLHSSHLFVLRISSLPQNP